MVDLSVNEPAQQAERAQQERDAQHAANTQAFLASPAGVAELEKRAVRKAEELVAARDVQQGVPGGSGGSGTAEPADAPPDAAERKMARTLAAAMAAAVKSGVFGERRSVESVPTVYAEQGVTAAQYTEVKACMKSVKLTSPDKWSDSEGPRDVKFFLQELKSFFEITCMPRAVWGLFARNFLSASPRKKWDREVEHLQREAGSAVIVWKDFETFMLRSYASMLPAREARHRYNGLRQTGSVKEFVREQIQLVRELEDTPFHPGGSVFDDFIRGLKSDVQTFVQDHAPSGWWTEIKDLYQKALDFEMNGIASTRARARARSPESLRHEVGSGSAQKRSGHAGNLSGNNNGNGNNGGGSGQGKVAGQKRPRGSSGGDPKGKRPWGTGLSAGASGSGGGNGVYITPDEMKARYLTTHLE